MTTQAQTAENGVNVAALLGARKALSDAPEAARFKWRATSQWLKGTHSRATVDGFFGLGGEQTHRQTYRFDSDHPEIFASEDNGATPLEFVLVGLAGCLTDLSWMLRCCATAAMPAVRQPARPTRTNSKGVAPLSSDANISG